MRPTKTKINLKTFFYALLWIAVIGAGLFVVVVRPLQIRNQKAQFDKAEASLDALVLEIEAKIGKADEVKKEKSCGRANLKNAEGPLGCDVNISMLYRNSDSEKSNNYINRIMALGKNAKRGGSGATQGDSFVPQVTQPGIQVFYQDIMGTHGVTCAISYRYPSLLDQNAITNEESFSMGLNCGGPAMKEYYL